MRVRTIAFCLLAMSVGCGAARSAEKPFFGAWSCTTVVDNAVNTLDWRQETYNDEGVSLGGNGAPEKLKIKLLKKNVYELTYGDGGKARLVMKEPWMFMRGTLEHSYLCLRKAS